VLNNSFNGIIPKHVFKDDIVYILNFGDVHYGNIACNKDFFKKAIKYVENSHNGYWLSTGDLLDVNISKSKFYDPDGLQANQEFNEVVDLLTPIKSKCLGFVGSNHSNRIHKLAGLNLDQILAKFLDIPYLGVTGLINCTLHNDKADRKGNTSYYITLTHGMSGGTTLGAKANSVSRLYDMLPNVDICLEGHTHTFLTSIKEVNSIDRSNNKLKTNSVTLCVAGHCLDWSKSYASGHKYQPTPIGFPLIILFKKDKRVDIKFLTPADF